jgi:hypothetical protein
VPPLNLDAPRLVGSAGGALALDGRAHESTRDISGTATERDLFARVGGVRARIGSRLDAQTTQLIFWTARQIAEHPDRYFVPELRQIEAPTAAEKERNEKTVALYKDTFRSFLWTGFECSNPILAVGRDRPLAQRRWDQNALAGFYDPSERRRQIDLMTRRLGLENARVGLSNHLIVKRSGAKLVYDWSSFDAIYRDLSNRGRDGKVRTALDILHFSLPDAFFEGDRIGFLHPDWPSHLAHFATAAVERYPEIDAITLINEPFVTNNFSAGHWNEGVGGNAAFIERAILMGKAALMARAEIEAHLERTGGRKLFLHNDSCEFRSDDPDFNDYKRFLTSDLILGSRWLLEGDFTKSAEYAWMRREFGNPEREPALRRALHEIRDLHRRFEDCHQKDTKADTVFGMDYYVTCESGPGITHDPDLYKNEAQQTRHGLYEMGQDYWGRYHLPLFHAETNMREDRAVDWMTQQLIELAALMRSGANVLGATWYSLMDQVGWENGLNGEVVHSLEKAIETNRLNPIGLVTLVGHDPRASAKLIGDLSKTLDEKLNRS